MTRTLGLDILPKSKFQVQYAVALVDTVNNDVILHHHITVNKLLQILLEDTIDQIAVDHINELLVDPRIAEYLVDTPHIHVYQVSTERRNYTKGIAQLAKEAGIAIRKKPNPVKTAILCALLVSDSGTRVVFYREDGKIRHKFGTTAFYETSESIIKKVVSNDPREYTHRRVKSIIENSPYIKSIQQVIGFGKEAIVYRVVDLMNRDCVIKVFRSYSPISKSIHSETYKAKQAHIPLLMARNEQLFLELLERAGIAVPQFYFRDDAIIGMQTMLDGDDRIAPTLAQIPGDHQFELEHVESLMEQSLDHLYTLFGTSHIVHGDYSANNLLYVEGNVYVIDVSQAKRVNTNTFIPTPVRLRMDRALDVLFRDLSGILTFFEKEFRITIERDVIFDEFTKLIPEYFIDKVEFVVRKWEPRFQFFQD